jgi:long-subunit acyl-CoA synthetase (AMP-forming)
MSAFKTPIEMLDRWADLRPDAVYLRQPRDGVYHDFTWKEVQRQSRQLAGALQHLGLAPGDKIALLSKNCAEWFITDLALMLGGYVSVPIYPTANAETIRHLLEHSEARAIFVGKLDDLPAREAGVGNEILRLALPYDTMPARYDWQQLLQLGRPLEDSTYPAPDRVMSIMYTSGSTALPKGAVHTFASLGWAGWALSRDLGGTEQDRVVSYLPLAHITERAYVEIGSLYTGGLIGFVESHESFMRDVQHAAPTLFLSVPRLWALFRERILERLGAKRLLLGVPLIGKAIKHKIRDRLGLRQAKVLGSGSAPISPTLLEWYRGVGMNITEAWGMTENCAYATLNYPFDATKIGSVGRPGLECEVQASDEGELLFRSPGLMIEYYKQPQATAAAFTDDGFFRTGDLCRIDDDGYVYITGRLKDNFKTAKGKYVAPLPIEHELARDTHVEQSCVMGSGMKQPVALVQLSDDARALPREKVRTSLAATLAAVNSGQESHATLDAIVVVAEPWTIENDMLTPSLKIKRHVVERHLVTRVQGLSGGQVFWEDELRPR